MHCNCIGFLNVVSCSSCELQVVSYESQYVVKLYHYGADSLKKMKNPPNDMKNQLKLIRLLGFEPHITIAQLHTITRPALIIGGDQDVIWPQHTLLIAQSIPRAYLWILPNSGHSTPIYYKDEFTPQWPIF
jgi:pimeloyl-ACP methyl ester carboxylesterase